MLDHILRRSPRHRDVRRVATVGDVVLAESENTQMLDGHEYFASDTVRWEFLEPSHRTSVCAWKGVATYYDVVVDGQRLKAAAWSYQTPNQAADSIRSHVAFWRGVRVNRGDELGSLEPEESG